LDPHADIFRYASRPSSSSHQTRSRRRRQRLRAVADDVEAFGDREFDFTAAFRWLRKKWASNNPLRRRRRTGLDVAAPRPGQRTLPDRLPVDLRRRDAPTLADGDGVKDVRQAIKLRMKSFNRVGQELFLSIASLTGVAVDEAGHRAYC